MLPKRRRRIDFDRAFRHAHRPTEKLYRAEPRMFNFVNKASLDEVSVVIKVTRVEDGTRRNAALGELAHGLIFITREGPRFNDCPQRVPVLVPICLLNKSRISYEFLSINDAT